VDICILNKCQNLDSVVYHKNILYECADYVTIHEINNTDEYVYQTGFSDGVKRTKIWLLKETVNGVFNGKFVLHTGTKIYSIFQQLYSKTINCSLENFAVLKKDLFTYYLRIGIYLHGSVFDFLEKIIISKRPQLYCDSNQNIFTLLS
jgi:hypothetical protein